jgi:hypothetical protein
MEHEAILEKLDEMNKRLERIERKLGVVEESCSSMDSHIGFVEGLYTTLQSPLHYVVSRITGYDESLPAAPSSQKRIENGQTQSVIAKQK